MKKIKPNLELETIMIVTQQRKDLEKLIALKYVIATFTNLDTKEIEYPPLEPAFSPDTVLYYIKIHLNEITALIELKECDPIVKALVEKTPVYQRHLKI
jgi:hypothetical protein